MKRRAFLIGTPVQGLVLTVGAWCMAVWLSFPGEVRPRGG